MESFAFQYEGDQWVCIKPGGLDEISSAWIRGYFKIPFTCSCLLIDRPLIKRRLLIPASLLISRRFHSFKYHAKSSFACIYPFSPSCNSTGLDKFEVNIEKENNRYIVTLNYLFQLLLISQESLRTHSEWNRRILSCYWRRRRRVVYPRHCSTTMWIPVLRVVAVTFPVWMMGVLCWAKVPALETGMF